jgi:hypothetical protein
MSIRLVTPADGSGAITVAWDNSQLTVPAYTIVDIPPASAMEAAYGASNLTALGGPALADALQGTGGPATSNT